MLAGLSRAPQFVLRGSPVNQQSGPVNHQNGPVNHQTGPINHQNPPKFRDNGHGIAGAVLGEDVDAVIVPADACGGVGTLAFSRGVLGRKPPLIIAVGENQTVLDDTPGRVRINAVRWGNDSIGSASLLVLLLSSSMWEIATPERERNYRSFCQIHRPVESKFPLGNSCLVSLFTFGVASGDACVTTPLNRS